ncbi:AMP-binding protein [Streptomyces sp. NPDC002763]|uniref:AMP-binding protein n=1 Tax=Streptomyces sp. NPDC002763 TaxID=3154427 RepID=UPI00331B44FD
MGERETLSYGELDARANRLAHYLISRGADPGTTVALCLERGVEVVVALYAVAKAGAAYMPLGSELPDGRLAFMLGDTGPGLVLTADAGSRRIPDGPWETVSVSDDARWAALPGTAPDVAASPQALAYLLYSSIDRLPQGRRLPGGRGASRHLLVPEQIPLRARRLPAGRRVGGCP